MTKVKIAEEIADRIRSGDGPIELVDSQGQIVGVVRRPPTDAEIARARSRASQGRKRLTWAQVAATLNDGAIE